MVVKVSYSKRALRKLHEIIEYLQDNHSLQAAINFNAEISKRILQLKKQPGIGRKSATAKTVRHVPVGKHRRMYYRVIGTNLRIVGFFDTRQHPNKSIF
ncbi:MAG: type II toxin-antitoxin system RelE/ParE family toxin [Saprospiraceae bacterium]|nr:type II toxin-antitoxin system RelE/ParE family toxin [Saprospiraceae bacterium]MCF8252707.1 type II toxin-antitoxin system RelE/ParE family toxin [Saprospiraceae bacterium]MCF8282931.1 type II toxin-antitoxin system RelE/ParE family toxin [Bacteroidales bacterium]MCF8311645.1 type II toxin-antitoxin system RelE/ParE family toxin [Saprospiraceae bacterium]MCF8440986.1 type II toxin-antitoxin system RelE/ParE family toxin [Saprospiraceae bacterium]